MAGILYIDWATVEATTGHMLVTFTSGGEDFRFHLPGHIALLLQHKVTAEAWRVCTAPKAEVVSLDAKARQATRRKN